MTLENQNPPSSEEKATHQISETAAQVGQTATEFQPPPPKSQCKDTRKQTKHWLDYVTFGLELLGLIVLCIYAGYTIKIYCANRDAANAAQSAAITAKEAVHLSERAYITIGNPQIDFKTKTVTLNVVNSGRISSGSADVIAHAFIMNVTDPHAPMIYLKDAVEKSWNRSHYPSVPIGSPFQLNHVFKKMDETTFNAGRQHIIIVGSAFYNDGFPDVPIQRSAFCMDAIFNTAMKRILMTPCDPDVYLPAAEIADGYPNNEDK